MRNIRGSVVIFGKLKWIGHNFLDVSIKIKKYLNYNVQLKKNPWEVSRI